MAMIAKMNARTMSQHTTAGGVLASAAILVASVISVPQGDPAGRLDVRAVQLAAVASPPPAQWEAHRDGSISDPSPSVASVAPAGVGLVTEVTTAALPPITGAIEPQHTDRAAPAVASTTPTFQQLPAVIFVVGVIGSLLLLGAIASVVREWNKFVADVTRGITSFLSSFSTAGPATVEAKVAASPSPVATGTAHVLRIRVAAKQPVSSANTARAGSAKPRARSAPSAPSMIGSSGVVGKQRSLPGPAKRTNSPKSAHARAA
jgi:hypothetical protein